MTNLVEPKPNIGAEDLARAKALLISTAETLCDLVIRLRRNDEDDPVYDDALVAAYHRHRVAAERFDLLSRRCVDNY